MISTATTTSTAPDTRVTHTSFRRTRWNADVSVEDLNLEEIFVEMQIA